MSTLKVAGFLTLAAGIACLAFVPRMLETGDVVAGVPVYAVVLGAVGLFLGVLGLVFLMRTPAARDAPEPVAQAAPAAEPIVIKRTQMDWGGNAPPEEEAGPAEAASADALEDVRRRMGKLKVDFGLGKLSANAYHELMRELEAEEAAILSARRAEGGT